MSLTSFFLARAETAKLGSSISKRIPYLVWLDIMLFVYFPISAFAKRRSDPANYGAFFVNAAIISATFLVSLAMIRLGRIFLSAYIVMIGAIAEVGNLALFTPVASWIDLYRVGVFIIGAMAVANLAALRRWQIFAYYFSGLAITLAFVALKAFPVEGGFGKEGGTILFLFIVLFTATSFVTLLLYDLNVKLVAMAESEARANKTRAEGLNALVSSVKGALETGRELASAAGEGQSRAGEIRSRLDSLKARAATLEERAAAVDEASSLALSRIDAAKTTAERQDEVIANARDAMDGIDGAIRDIASLAEGQRASSDAVAALAESQRTDIKGLREGIERIRASSAAVIEAAAGILDISDKTNLLAMNASIEAAHAGSSGRGFAVISGEIRKLSQDTQDGTKRIGEAVKTNEASVAAQAQFMGRFTAGMDSMIADVKSTVLALGRMLDGLGRIGAAAGGLRSAAGALQGFARETSDSVLSVAEGLRAGALSAAAAKDFASDLSAEAEAMLEAFAVMESAVEKAARVGDESLARVAELDSGLTAISGGKRR